MTNVSVSKKKRSPNYEVHNIFQIIEAQIWATLKGTLVAWKKIRWVNSSLHVLAYAPLCLPAVTYSILENVLQVMWVSVLPNYSVMAKGDPENIASGLFIFSFHIHKTALKKWSFQANYFTQKINSVVHRGLGLTSFITMIEMLGLDLSIGGSLVCREALEYCPTMQTFEQWFSTLAIY